MWVDICFGCHIFIHKTWLRGFPVLVDMELLADEGRLSWGWWVEWRVQALVDRAFSFLWGKEAVEKLRGIQ
jgi:hypothetical protein